MEGFWTNTVLLICVTLCKGVLLRGGACLQLSVLLISSSCAVLHWSHPSGNELSQPHPTPALCPV